MAQYGRESDEYGHQGLGSKIGEAVGLGSGGHHTTGLGSGTEYGTTGHQTVGSRIGEATGLGTGLDRTSEAVGHHTTRTEYGTTDGHQSLGSKIGEATGHQGLAGTGTEYGTTGLGTGSHLGETHEKKGMMEKIKDKLPGHH